MGWTAFVTWSISFYPQVFLNYRRKRCRLLLHIIFSIYCMLNESGLVCGLNEVFVFCSVVGLNFDFVVLNLTKRSSFLIYNASLYFSKAVQKQYLKKYGA